MTYETSDQLGVRYALSPSVVVREAGEGALIVHLGTKRIHRISSLGHAIYQQCAAGKTLREICEFVALRQGVPEEEVLPKVSKYLQEFEERQVLKEIADGG